MQLKRDADLVTAALLAAGGAVVIEYAPYAYVRLAFALPLLFMLPGYAIANALFVDDPRPLPQLALLTIGLSLSVSILTALVLSLATNGLRIGSWLTVVVAIVLGACWVVIRRREDYYPDVPRSTVRLRANRRDVVLMVIAALVVVGALLFARTPLPAKDVQGYTALAIAESSAGRRPMVRVNVTSQELETRSYRLTVTSGSKVVHTTHVELVPGQKWSANVRVPVPPTGRQVRVEAALYWNRRPHAKYRSVYVWMGSGAHR